MGQRFFLAVFFPLSLSLSLSRAILVSSCACSTSRARATTDGPARATVTVFVLRLTADGGWGNADKGRGERHLRRRYLPVRPSRLTRFSLLSLFSFVGRRGRVAPKSGGFENICASPKGGLEGREGRASQRVEALWMSTKETKTHSFDTALHVHTQGFFSRRFGPSDFEENVAEAASEDEADSADMKRCWLKGLQAEDDAHQELGEDLDHGKDAQSERHRERSHQDQARLEKEGDRSSHDEAGEQETGVHAINGVPKGPLCENTFHGEGEGKTGKEAEEQLH